MADSGSATFGNSGAVEITGKIIVIAIILLICIVFFIFCLHLYTKWYWYRSQVNASNSATRRRRRRSRIDFAAGHHELRRGLDPVVLKTIPIILYDPKEFKDGLECAVCLCEVSEGEKARLLPKCNHGFHVECIDLWFQSHSTCPICRNPAVNLGQSSKKSSAADSTLESIRQIPVVENSGANGLTTEAPNFPTNVLFWGDETQVSTFGPCGEEDPQSCGIGEPSSSSSSLVGSRGDLPDGILVINIPRSVNEEEEQKSSVPTGLRSLKRLLSGNRRVSPSPWHLGQV